MGLVITCKKGLTEEQAVSEIRRCSGVQFDLDIVKIFFDEVRGLMPMNGEADTAQE